ncbi:hypothetical protein ABUW04_31070 [Streptacidiphilus sp. N1-10]|uniref:PEGA domain-containing protein n=1 Tax=Streptacidiphilus jeojiensis TaxID=3229225 RepID=A0ABV6XWS7_9ACTN
MDDGEASPGARGSIVLSRDRGGYRDVLRRYAVLVDGVQVGLIGRGQTLRLAVAAGEHRLQLKIDWCSSVPLTAVVEAGEDVCFVCAPGGGAAEAVGAVTAGMDAYITLRQAKDVPAVVSAPLSWAARFRLGAAFGFFGGALVLVGAGVWHLTGVAPGADNAVGLASLLFTLACMIAFRTGEPRKTGRRDRDG